MAGPLTAAEERGVKARAALRATFTDANPCAWCGCDPTLVIQVIPSKYNNGKLVHRGHPANVCWECSRRLGFHLGSGRTPGYIVDSRAGRQADKRADARKAMKGAQGALFDLGPDDAVTGG